MQASAFRFYTTLDERLKRLSEKSPITAATYMRTLRAARDQGIVTLAYARHLTAIIDVELALREKSSASGTSPQVFLGGACGNTTWRKNIAIPLLEEADITYYDPQYPEGSWTEELIPIEAIAKEEAEWVIVVIDGATRGTASIMEAVELICVGANVALVVDDVPENTIAPVDPGDPVHVEHLIVGRELKDANRARHYLRSVLKRRRPDLPLRHNVKQATEMVIRQLKSGA